MRFPATCRKLADKVRLMLAVMRIIQALIRRRDSVSRHAVLASVLHLAHDKIERHLQRMPQLGYRALLGLT